MFRPAVICAALLATAFGVSAQAGELTSLDIDKLAPHDCLMVRTTQYVLRLDIVDPATGEAMGAVSSDGEHFGPADRVFVLGATKGRHPQGMMFVRMGRLEVGKGIELAFRTLDASDRRITAPVKSFHLLHRVAAL